MLALPAPTLRPMTLKEKLNQDLYQAMRQRDNLRRDTIRLVLSAVTNAEIEKHGELADAEVIAVISKEVRLRQESITEFEKGNRPDLVARESAERSVLLEYLPQQMSREEIVAQAKKVIAELGAQGPKDKGKVMPHLVAELRGRADGREINAVVTELLAS